MGIGEKIVISVVIPVRNEEKYIASCLDGVSDWGIPLDELEVIIVDGCSNDSTVEILKAYSNVLPNFTILNNALKTVPNAMNYGISMARGRYIARMDAHAKYPRNYLRDLLLFSEKLHADNIGGVLKTLPHDSGLIPTLIANFMSSAFGVGDSSFRVGITSEFVLADTVPFGFFKKEIFDRIGFYDLSLIRNQDDELNARITNSGGKIYLLRDVIIEYYTRDSMFKFSSMLYQYGLFKPLVVKKVKKLTSLRQLVPLLFLWYLVIAPFGVIQCGLSPILVIAPLILYAFMSSLFYINAGGLLRRVPLFVLVCFIGHISYGYGYFVGIFKVVIQDWGNAPPSIDSKLTR